MRHLAPRQDFSCSAICQEGGFTTLEYRVKEMPGNKIFAQLGGLRKHTRWEPSTRPPRRWQAVGGQHLCIRAGRAQTWPSAPAIAGIASASQPLSSWRASVLAHSSWEQLSEPLSSGLPLWQSGPSFSPWQLPAWLCERPAWELLSWLFVEPPWLFAQPLSQRGGPSFWPWLGEVSAGEQEEPGPVWAEGGPRPVPA